MNLSRDLTEKYKEKERNRSDGGTDSQSRIARFRGGADHPVDFNVMVLGTNFWPMQAPPSKYNVPHEIKSVYDRFTKFHGDVHS